MIVHNSVMIRVCMCKKYLNAKLEMIFLIKSSDQNSSVFPFASCVVSWSKRFSRVSVPPFSLYTLLGQRKRADLGRSSEWETASNLFQMLRLHQNSTWTTAHGKATLVGFRGPFTWRANYSQNYNVHNLFRRNPSKEAWLQSLA